MPALTSTNPLFKKTGVLKLNDVYKLQISKCVTTTGFDVEHIRFTLASSVHSHYTRFSKSLNFITERLRTRLDLNFFKYLSQKLWSIVSKKLMKI